MKVPDTDRYLKVDKSNSTALGLVALSAVIVVFCAFSVKALLAQGAYQRRVVNAKHDTVNQLKDNIEAGQTLTKQYEVFEAANPNSIGGRSDVPDNAPPPDGKNSRIILDALPTSYDFPALISSLSKLLDMNGISNRSIGGSDQAAGFPSGSSGNPKPANIDQIPITGTTSYGGLQNLIKDLERSTRPYDVVSIQLGGTESATSLSLIVNTVYQPAKTISLESKEVK